MGMGLGEKPRHDSCAEFERSGVTNTLITGKTSEEVRLSSAIFTKDGNAILIIDFKGKWFGQILQREILARYNTFTSPTGVEFYLHILLDWWRRGRARFFKFAKPCLHRAVSRSHIGRTCCLPLKGQDKLFQSLVFIFPTFDKLCELGIACFACCMPGIETFSMYPGGISINTLF